MNKLKKPSLLLQSHIYHGSYWFSHLLAVSAVPSLPWSSCLHLNSLGRLFSQEWPSVENLLSLPHPTPGSQIPHMRLTSHDECGSPLILEGVPALTGPTQAPESMNWAFLHPFPSLLQSMSQESHSVPPQIVPCSFYDPGWVTLFLLYSGGFSIGLSCRIRLWVRFYSKVCASQLASLKILFFPLLKYKQQSSTKYNTKQTIL